MDVNQSRTHKWFISNLSQLMNFKETGRIEYQWIILSISEYFLPIKSYDRATYCLDCLSLGKCYPDSAKRNSFVVYLHIYCRYMNDCELMDTVKNNISLYIYTARLNLPRLRHSKAKLTQMSNVSTCINL